MKKEFRRIAMCLVLACVLLGGCFYGVKLLNKSKKCEIYVSEKVRFEGIDVASNETTFEIAEKINAFSDGYARLIVKLDNAYDDEKERVVDENMSLDEYQALLKEHRQEVKEYYTRSNAELVAKLDWSSFYQYI